MLPSAVSRECGSRRFKDHLAAEHGTLRRLKLHRDVKPVEDPAASKLTALDGLCKFNSVIARFRRSSTR
jgi:hypothetical protein